MPAKSTRGGDRPGVRTTSTGTHLAPERRAVKRPGDHQQQAAPGDRGLPSGDAADPEARQVDVELELEEGETTLFEAAISAFHAGEFTRAESLFLEEAARALDAAPQRAAIAYRQAALAARSAGNLDGSDHWMRLAGREYLRVSEDVRTPLPFIREAAVMAAKCFLSVENLHVATKGLRRAQAIESVLRADDDLMAGSTEIPFRHETALYPPDVPAVLADGTLGADGTRAGSAGAAPVVLPGDAGDRKRAGPTDPTEGWLRRLRQRLPHRPAA